jgi:hypothetical protein
MGEVNSVSCGGQPGVSDVYAASLWGLDYLLLMARNGAAGVNFHTGIGSCSGYAVICGASAADLAANVLKPQPLYYGMLMFHLVGAGQMLPVTVTAASANLTGYAVRGGDGRTRVMLVDKDPTGGPAVTVNLTAGTAAGTAQVLRLTGTSLTSAHGIAIQSATVDAAGHFTPGAAEDVASGNGAYTLTVPTGSAALVTLP